MTDTPLNGTLANQYRGLLFGVLLAIILGAYGYTALSNQDHKESRTALETRVGKSLDEVKENQKDMQRELKEISRALGVRR